MVSSLKKLNFDDKSALEAGDILRNLKTSGKLLNFRDVFIASICINNKIELLTYNKKHFERLSKHGLILVTTDIEVERLI